MNTLGFISLALSIACYSVSQLQQHGKLRWMKKNKPTDFWGEESWTRKYHKTDVFNSPDNWYYRWFRIGVRERFPLSATFLVFLTDGYHMCQSMSFILLSLSLSILTNVNFFLIWGGILLVHFVTYKALQR